MEDKSLHLGTYVSEDGNQILIINVTNSTLGYIDGTFINKQTPMGEMEYAINNGNSRWVYTRTAEGSTGIGIYPWYRTNNWDEGIMDYWCGSCTENGGLIMSGSLSYFTFEGKQETISFSNVKFIRS